MTTMTQAPPTRRPENWPNCARNLLDGLNDCAAKGRLDEALDNFSARELARLLDDWEFVARKDQWPPDLAANGLPWRVWLILGGRGAGKTRAGAEWVKGLALGRPQFSVRPVGRIALIGETAADVRDVMIEGVSGLLAVHDKRDRPTLGKFARAACVWRDGAVAQVFSAEDPESLRGPQFRRRLVRRTRQMALRQGDMGHAAIRPAPRRLAATAGDDDAAPAAAPASELIAASRHGADARVDPRTTPHNLAPSFLQAIDRAICRHAARTTGDRRRNRRGAPGRAVDARHAGDGAHRARRRRCAHRRRGRSAGLLRQARRQLRHRRGWRRCATARSSCSRTRRSPPRGRPQWARAAIALYHEL